MGVSLEYQSLLNDIFTIVFFKLHFIVE